MSWWFGTNGLAENFMISGQVSTHKIQAHFSDLRFSPGQACLKSLVQTPYTKVSSSLRSENSGFRIIEKSFEMSQNLHGTRTKGSLNDKNQLRTID